MTMTDTETTTKRPPPPPVTGRGGSTTQYRELPEGTWRFVIGEPKVSQEWSERFQKWSTNVNIPMTLTEDEKKRLKAEHGEAPEGVLQSWRPAFGSYRCGWTLNETSAGKESNLVTFLAAAFGSKNSADLRKWVKAGGAPDLTAPDVDGQIKQLSEWLRWTEGAEVWATIQHHTGNNGQTLARVSGFMAVGSLPGQPEPEYNATWKGKLRAMLAEETRPSPAEEGVAEGAAVADAARNLAAEGLPDQAPVYTSTGEPICTGDILTCKCAECADKLRAKAAQMFGSAA